MTNLYIPPIREDFVLAEPWTFDLSTYRIGHLIERAGLSEDQAILSEDQRTYHITLPTGSILSIIRYTLRQGRPPYLTFRLAKKEKNTLKFCAKFELSLDYVNHRLSYLPLNTLEDQSDPDQGDDEVVAC